ncbi:unnamed protein product [Caenorhabditis brenneri]
MPKPCVMEGNCPMNIETRKNCSSCRFRKCLEIGMGKEEHMADPKRSTFSTSMFPPSSTPMPSPRKVPQTMNYTVTYSDLDRSSSHQTASGSDTCEPDTALLTRKDCVVCGERAGKTAFGVACCNSCRHFFSRASMRENRGELYHVCFSKKCKEDVHNSCRSCRYRKCLSSGMRPIQLETNYDYDRTDLLKLYSGFLPTQNGRNPTSVLSEEAVDIILNYLYSFHPSKQNPQWNKPFINIPTSGSLESFLEAWEQFSIDIEYGIRISCDFFKTLPEHRLLTQEELIFLLKKNFFSIYLIRVSRGVSFQQSVFHGGVLDFSTLEMLFGATIFPGSQLANRIVTFLTNLRMICEEWQLALLIPLLFFQNTGHHEKLHKMNIHFGNVILQNMKAKPGCVSYLMENVLPELNLINFEFNHVLNKLRENVDRLELSSMFMELASITQNSSNGESSNQTSEMYYCQTNSHGTSMN